MTLKRERNAVSRGQGGQVLLIVILLVAVTVVGLSLMTRNIVSLRIATEEAESQRAQAAAEAGVERVIQASIPIGISDSLTNNSQYETTVDEIKSSSFLINGGNNIPKDEGADVWFVDHDSNNAPVYSQAKSAQFFNLYWGLASEVCGTPTAPAAIEAIVVTRDNTTGETKSYRYVYDACGTRGNNFTQAEPGNFTVAGVTFTNRTSPQNDLAKNVNDIVFIRVIPIYKDAVIAVSACNHSQTPATCTSLPSQGYVITSTGISGQANSKFTVFKGYPQAYLPYLSYGLFVVN